MAAPNTSSVPSLPLPCPKSPPLYPDLYGKRRELLKVQMIEREIGFLEEELKSLESLQPASRHCKEVDEFVGAKSDPLIPVDRKIRRSHCLWKWLCGKSCFNLSWICCSSSCSLHLESPSCCACRPSIKLPRCHSLHCCHLKRISCSRCCFLPNLSCPDCCSCSRCTCSCPKCTNLCYCPNCTKTWCNPCCLCY
ncbi:guanine nucleotide-binding protein subunit gamma 3 [Macadamia integrifolia]|uniref:guanine nucleotide-binding protein subunit gamma 3 n=1 Tax=Macadamia integrifolia TaxID=60698 RepID=UPI001C4E72E6|nr:guanine nucleotide-binding protein subunit gamma 3 [Macadamia integrifolia]XP_042485780.1 guanine nucleotide-binding protein subunit gamma 3 [Macadamia integrifolia]